MRGTILDEMDPDHGFYLSQLGLLCAEYGKRDGLGFRRCLFAKHPLMLRETQLESDYSLGETYIQIKPGDCVLLSKAKRGTTGEAYIEIELPDLCKSVEVSDGSEITLVSGLPKPKGKSILIAASEFVSNFTKQSPTENPDAPTLLEIFTAHVSGTTPEAMRKTQKKPVPVKNSARYLGPEELELIEQMVPSPQPAGYGEF